jgi:hypothetical protein
MTETALVKSLSDIERDTEAVSLTQQANDLAIEVSRLEITDERSNLNANDLRLKAKALEKELDTRRKFFVDPHNQFVKTINGWFKNPLEVLAQSISSLNGQMIAYVDKKEAEAAEAERKILADKRTLPETKSEKLTQVEQAPKVVSSSAGQTSFRIDKRVEIFSPYDVPREYCVPSLQLVELALKNGRDVPGARIVEVKIPVGRSNF